MTSQIKSSQLGSPDSISTLIFYFQLKTDYKQTKEGIQLVHFHHTSKNDPISQKSCIISFPKES